MATEGSRPVRHAILIALKNTDAVTALVPAASIYSQSPQDVPSWPFIKYGTPSAVPIEAACVDGDEISVAVHSFSKGLRVGDTVTETAEDHCDRIGREVMRALHRVRLDLGNGVNAKVRRTGFRLLEDGAEAGAYHHVAEFRVRTIS